MQGKGRDGALARSLTPQKGHAKCPLISKESSLLMATGTVPTPDRDVFVEVARRITIDGGKVLSARHSGKPLVYPTAVDDDARRRAENGARSTHCGDHRLVMIPYMRPDEETDQEIEKHYIACVNCDAVPLQPRWFTGKWASK